MTSLYCWSNAARSAALKVSPLFALTVQSRYHSCVDEIRDHAVCTSFLTRFAVTTCSTSATVSGGGAESEPPYSPSRPPMVIVRKAIAPPTGPHAVSAPDSAPIPTRATSFGVSAIYLYVTMGFARPGSGGCGGRTCNQYRPHRKRSSGSRARG